MRQSAFANAKTKPNTDDEDMGEREAEEESKRVAIQPIKKQNRVSKKGPVNMQQLREMLFAARSELTAMMDLSHFLLMTKEEAQQQFMAWQANTGVQNPDAIPQQQPFAKKVLHFGSNEKQRLLQEAYDYAAHVHSLKQTLVKSRSRVAQIKAQVSKDRQGFHQLMALRKKYTLSSFTKNDILGNNNTIKVTQDQMPTLQLDNLFVINMEFQDLMSTDS